MIKKDTLVALLDGRLTASDVAAPSQEAVQKKLPTHVKRFKHLSGYSKLLDKILLAMDPRKFTETVLASEAFQRVDKLGVVYMGLKEGPDSELPRVYLQEMDSEGAFLSAISQRYVEVEDNLRDIPVSKLKHGFYRVEGVTIIWPWATDGEKPDVFPTVTFEDIGTEISIDEPFSIESDATVKMANGREMKTGPLNLLFEKEGVSFDNFGNRWRVQGCTAIISASAKRKAKAAERAALSPKRRKKTSSSGQMSTSPQSISGIGAALARRLGSSSSSSGAMHTAVGVLMAP
jgi:hypothetical protein